MTRPLALAALLAAIPFATTLAQSGDTLRLPDLREAAFRADPRATQVEIIARQSELRLRNIRNDLRPSVSLDAQGQYQSDVASIPLSLPGVTLPTQPHATYDARLSAQQRIYDPTITSRQTVERAQSAESQARARTVLYSLSESVNSAFFAGLRSQVQMAELETTLTDLEAQLTVADARVKAGAALPGESSALRAEILRRRQSVAEQRAVRRTALAILSDLTGTRISQSAALSVPDLTVEMPSIRDSRNRPEYALFDRSRERLRAMQSARSAQDMPRLSAFGRLGYGRPGLRFLSDKFDSYWITGVQLQWIPWNWGAARRDRQSYELEQAILLTEERSFTASLRRAIEQDLAAIERLDSALVQDDEIIALRENILLETRARYAESVISSAEYVDRQTDVLAARLSRAIHRVELSQSRAHLLSTLGMEIR